MSSNPSRYPVTASFPWLIVSPGAASDMATVINTLGSEASPGQVIYFPAGTYSCLTPVVLYPFVTYMGDTKEKTIIQQAAGANLAALAASQGWAGSTATQSVDPITMRNLTWDGNVSNQTGGTGHGVVLQTFRSTIIDCVFSNTVGDGLRFDYFGANGTTHISNTAVENRVARCQARINGGQGIHVSDSSNNTFTDGFITDCIVQSPGLNGIYVQSGGGWKIDGNHIYGTIQESGIRVDRAFETRIIGNYIETWGLSATISTYCAVDCLRGMVNDNGSGSVIAGNVMHVTSLAGNVSSTLAGIGVQATSTGQANVTITGNEIYSAEAGSGYIAIDLTTQGAGGSVNAAISGNNVDGSWGTQIRQGGAGTITLVPDNVAGSNLAGSTPVLTPTFSNGVAAQLTDLTRDYMVYLEVGTAGTAMSVTIGPTSAASAATVSASGTATTGQLLSFRLPAGWFVKWSATTATLANQTAVAC